MLKIPINDRCFHTVFGRTKVPLDFFADVEFPTHAAKQANDERMKLQGLQPPSEDPAAGGEGGLPPSKNDAPYTGESVLIHVIKAAHAVMLERYKAVPDVTAVFDGQATADKHSYHVHMRINDAAFGDFTAVRELHSEINFLLPLPAIDLSCCRPHGMLRMGFTHNTTLCFLVFHHEEDHERSCLVSAFCSIK